MTIRAWAAIRQRAGRPVALPPEVCACAVGQAGVMGLDDIDRLDGVNGVDGRGLVGAHPRVSRRRRPDGDRGRLDVARWSPDVVHRRRTSSLGPVD
ncbi:hypothetical protein [Streptomyces flaveus]|uniref:hypothetical protein n=1 Tax=Streptomyces flaveus TaxID=66370 RepID=UPI003317EBA2